MSLCFDTTFVVDYLHGVEATVEYLEANEYGEFYLPSIVLYEGVQGVVTSRDGRDLPGFLSALDWAEVAPFTRATAVEAGELQRSLASSGDQLSALDAVIAGTASQLGAKLVTRDSDLLKPELGEAVEVGTY